MNKLMCTNYDETAQNQKSILTPALALLVLLISQKWIDCFCRYYLVLKESILQVLRVQKNNEC